MTTLTVLPPEGASSARDLWDLELPTEVLRANHDTHLFLWPENRCAGCDCRPSGEWARFACTGSPAGALPFETFKESNR